jgi:hypothetical protein
MKGNTFLLVISFSFLFACEKPIDIDLNSSDPKIVIVGSISSVTGDYTVTLTRTVNFDETNEFPAVSDALVRISDDAGNTETLNETSPGVYSITTLQGVPGRTYTLEVTADGEIYTAISTMPLPIDIDTITIENDEENHPLAAVRFQDPSGIENYYRLTQLATERFRFSGIVDDDRLQDGRMITISVPAISSRGNMVLRPGDSITVVLQSIDKNVYEYLRMLNELEQEDILGQTALSANPVSNFSHGALGYFNAYSQKAKTIVIQ